MSLPELWRHKSWIVQISQARIRIKRAGIKDSLCSFCYTLLFLFCWLWPWEIIVHRSLVSEIRLYSTTDHSNPSHMNIRCQNTKLIEPQIRNNSTCITGYYFRLYESKWDISPLLSVLSCRTRSIRSFTSGIFLISDKSALSSQRQYREYWPIRSCRNS